MMSDMLAAFVGSLEAAASVLLTVGYGTLAGYLDIVNNKSAVNVSKLAVRLFMPCLLFVNVGSAVSIETILKYTPIIIWSFGYNALCIVLGTFATKTFRLHTWITPAVTFNNSTSLPLLLLQSFSASGALTSISGGNLSDAISRAESYFLINAAISNTLTFSLGPALLHVNASGEEDKEPIIEREHVEVLYIETEPSESHEDDSEETERVEVGESEQTSLIVKRRRPRRTWIHSILYFFHQFWNPTFVGACLGIFVGLIPPLHHHFFDKDGVFFAWLTVSLRNVGNLFASTQVLVVGVKLHSTYVKMRQGQDSGSIPIASTVFVLLARFIIIPAIGILIIYALAAKTHLLSDDPILWFCLMMMPVGPTALRLTALADVSKADEEEKMVVAKFLALSYLVTPLISLAAVASLKACEIAQAQWES
ncbi:auxin efflux carrier [Lentinula raphanica]|uniref:Auxin efflux carrier n=1 Tax=Lentinula raphanica TaxID=153919 RepID=A0AA38UKJ4_9AGAR|nr:auxin efflux carrier [Lentinula raphanica]